MDLNRRGVWLVAMLAVAPVACSSSKPQASDGGTGGAGGGAAGGGAGTGGGAADSGARAAPRVSLAAPRARVAPRPLVATLSGVPASLATDGARLYATILPSIAGLDGKVQSVAKTATDATPDAGTVTTLASGLKQPLAIAVNGATVLWADSDVAFPGLPNLLAVPAAGGTPTELISGVYR